MVCFEEEVPGECHAKRAGMILPCDESPPFPKGTIIPWLQVQSEICRTKKRTPADDRQAPLFTCLSA